MRPWLTHAGAACLLVLSTAPVDGQVLPSEPFVFAGGVVTLSGDVSATVGAEDPGFFNYTDYEDSLLRMVRATLATAVRAGPHLSVLGEIRTQYSFALEPPSGQADFPEIYALYARVRPWVGRRFDVQIGRIPPTFGSFPRRRYESENPLIGYPLAFQYLTSLRADAIPSNADELLQMRGRGWLASYSVGNPAPAPGVPLGNALRWDTGVQAHVATDLVELTGSVTTGTLSNPLFRDDNGGRQVAARVEMHPTPGLHVGASGAHGPFVSDQAVPDGGGAGDGSSSQTAWGADAEYSSGYYLVRAEAVFSEWRLPTLADRLRSLGGWVEGRYKLRPGLYAAARLDHLTFSNISGSRAADTWDARVTRIEAGGGVSLQRNVLLKISVQTDHRDGGRTRDDTMLAGQLVYWF
jgi:hypothetical protein